MSLVNHIQHYYLPFICTVLVPSDCDDVTVSVRILRARIVCGGRHPISQTFNRMPLTDVTAPVASRK